ncbi:GntR family transcriptional regulator [Mameliella alba]|uniref:GntR family transcriptional regulator n=1 Tax=Mameliella alba TaxID=561184 RepID=UPI000B5327A7|nr:GntR family transcriptional regulator [Mameliella alba]MBY6122544.1 GntR family transcriptional regulator [Mameliella alba]OWV39351.1 GntR family transcriptional regulator [Mameliella alba]OWV52746.1 GntR family transcriptional regulator [Mameliella alba]
MTDEKPIELSQGQEAYRRILDEIRAGHLMPGDRLMEVELAKRLGFSRTPVREAIRQLEGDGVVTHVPRVGAAIRRLDHAEISELYDMRTVLEGTAARFAARAASEVELAELADIHAAMAAGDGDPFVLNRQFHAALLDAARNRFLMKAVASIHTTLLILGPTTLREEERAEDALREHAAILEGLQARDQDAAEQAMRAHIAAAHRARLRQLRRG